MRARTRFPSVRAVLGTVAAALALGGAAEPARAQWVRESEQFYLPASHNWVFRQNYSGADRLFNAFDYGHAILYEELYTRPEGPVERLEVREYDFLTRRLLRRPPRVPLEEGAIEVEYAKLAPEAKLMFEWAHVLHRQLYDVLADERLSDAQKDAAIAEVLAYYRSRPDLAFSSRPKSMDIMDGQHYSLAFREKYPKFNGLIWAYHWLQVGLYEPLLVHRDPAGRTAGVNATVTRFWQMLEDAPENMPYLMPMTAGVAPVFSARYPEAAIIFDNLHMMHDVISDILASPKVPRDRKRAEILRAAVMFRDDTSYVVPVEEWRSMGEMMGLNNMGGPAVGFLPELPRPTVPRGMSMAGMDHGVPGHGETGQGEAQHGAHAMPDSAGPGVAHGTPAGEPSRAMHELHARMMEDSVIVQRIIADTAMHRLMMQAMHGGAGGHEAHGAPAPAAVHGAVDFVARLLSDPQVAARVHADPELHRLWSDPAVQRRLADLRRERALAPAVAPAHRH